MSVPTEEEERNPEGQWSRTRLLTNPALRLAAFSMKENSPAQDGWRGSIVLVSSTSGYFGGTEVVSYVSSKHGIIGLLRSARTKAKCMGIRLNGVAPFITPAYITSGYSDLWNGRGLPINTPDQVALGILQIGLDPEMHGRCGLVRMAAENDKCGKVSNAT